MENKIIMNNQKVEGADTISDNSRNENPETTNPETIHAPQVPFSGSSEPCPGCGKDNGTHTYACPVYNESLPVKPGREKLNPFPKGK